jgi:hypothetical protein
VTPRSTSAPWRRVALAILLVLVLAGGLGSIFHALVGQTRADDNDDPESVANPPTRVTIKNGVTVLTLSDADVQNAGIECAHLAPAPAENTILGFATVLDPAALADLNSQYVDAETQVKSADAKLAISQAAFERAKVLYNDQQNISAAQRQSAQSGFENDTAALTTARARLTAVAAAARRNWGSVLGAALVNHAPLIAALIERHEYLAKVTLPAGVVPAAPPETAAAALNNSTKIRLAYVSLATATNPKLQGIGYFYTAPAQDELLPGLNLEVSLAVKSAERGWVVPNSAVVWLEGQAWIYIRSDARTFIRREISPDRPAGNDGYIIAELPPDAEVAVRGAQMLLSEEFRAQVPVED